MIASAAVFGEECQPISAVQKSGSISSLLFSSTHHRSHAIAANPKAAHRAADRRVPRVTRLE